MSYFIIKLVLFHPAFWELPDKQTKYVANISDGRISILMTGQERCVRTEVAPMSGKRIRASLV